MLKLTRRGSVYHATGTVAGQRIRQSLGTGDERQAQEACAQLEARLWQAHHYGVEAVATFEEAALLYMQDGGDPRFVTPLLKHFRGRALRTIRPKDLRDAARTLYPSASGATLNRQGITPARAIINRAAQEGLCQPIRVRQFSTEKPRRVAVQADFVAAFRAEALRRRKPYLAALARVVFETGARIGELVALEPRHLDLVKGRADLGRTKNGETYWLQFSEGARAELANLPPRRGRVFGYQGRSCVYGPWRTTCRLASLPYVPPHQMGRHSFATALQKAGWDANDIAQAGRWKSVRLVQETYVHPEDRSRLAAAQLGTELAQHETPGTVTPLTRKG